MSMDDGRISAEPTDTRALRDAFGRFATGVTIVTAMHETGPKAIAANSFSSVSLEPPLVLWSIAKGSRRFDYFAGAEHYAIHVLAAEQAELCRAVSSDANAIATNPFQPNPEGVPLLDGCLARFECRRSDAFAAGDHTIVLGEVLRMEMRDGAALTFFGGQFGEMA